MTTLGILFLAIGAALFALAVLAEANHPTGGDGDTGAMMRFGAIVAAIGTVVLALRLLVAPAQAQGLHCAPWPQLRDHLASQFDERPVAGGIITDRAIAQLFVARDGSTFTVVVVTATGLAGMRLAGRDWEATAAPEPPGEDL